MKCKNCKYFYKRPDITMFVCVKGKPHEDNTAIDCDNYAPMTNADRIRNMTDEELAEFIARNNYDCADYCEDAKCGCSWSCGNKDKTIALQWLQKESEDHG